MLATITNSFKSKWKRLTQPAGTKRLSWFALILLFALDGYILSLLFDGMSNAARMVPQPVHGVSRDCAIASEQFLLENAQERVDTLARAARDRKSMSGAFNNDSDRLLPLCSQIRGQWLSTVGNARLLELATERSRLLDETEKIQRDIMRLKDSYSSALLEKIARQKRSDSILPVEADQVKATIDEMNAALTEAQQRIAATENAMLQHPMVTAYLRYLATLPIQREFERETALYERAMFWHPFKVLAAQAGFILPLLGLAIFWNTRAIKKQWDTQILVSSHLILICALPVLIRLLYFIRDLLPEELLYRLLQALNQWRMGFVWYYGLIFACVGGGLLLIFIAQRTLFSAARLRAIRLRKTLCQACGEKLHSGEQAWCETCGASQSSPCRSCGQPRRLLAHHCSHCGSSA